MIDIDKAKMAFENYVKGFDNMNALIALKIEHTYGVMNDARKIATRLSLKTEDVQIATLIALLHDIGRFRQIEKYETLSDIDSIDHANLGVKILFDEGLMELFIQDRKYDKIIKEAIYNHNKLGIAEGLTNRELIHAQIIRDADKIDIYRVMEKATLETVLNKSEVEIQNDAISDGVFQSFIENRLVDRKDVKTPLDSWILMAAFIFDINFPFSLHMIDSINGIETIADRIKSLNSETDKRIKEIKWICKEYIRKNFKNST